MHTCVLQGSCREGSRARSPRLTLCGRAAPSDVARACACIRGERREQQNSQDGTLAGRIRGRQAHMQVVVRRRVGVKI